MSIFNRLFGNEEKSQSQEKTEKNYYLIPSNLTEKEFGKVKVTKKATEIDVDLTILMEPQGKEAEGWQTGVALDASASMKGTYGRMVEGSIPNSAQSEYMKKGWIKSHHKDGRNVKSFSKEAIADAVQQGYVKYTKNDVEPVARDFISYLAGNLDADGGTTLIYWACDEGSEFEVLGDFTESQCRNLEIQGPQDHSFGSKTELAPAVKYFVERFEDADRGIYIFITDGKIDDLDEVKRFTIKLAEEISSDRRNFLKCVLIGLGDEIDENQMEELDNLETGTDIDIWDHKIAKEMRVLKEIFAEVVSENQIVAPTAAIYDSDLNLVKRYSDGLPARISFSMPLSSTWFELEVAGRKVRQKVILD